MRHLRKIVLVFSIPAATVMIGCGSHRGSAPWVLVQLPVGTSPAGVPNRVDVNTVRVGSGSFPWIAAGDEVDAAGARHVQIWSSPSGAPGSWRRSTFAAVSIDGPQDSILSVAGTAELTVAVGIRASPLHGIPRASMWSAATQDSSAWTEARTDREEFGGENVVSIGRVTVGPHGATLAGGWVNAAGRSSAAVWRSPDGVSWHRNDSDPSFVGEGAELPHATDVADTTHGLVAVGSAPSPTPTDPTAEHGAIWWSPDGGRWDRMFVAAGARPGTQVTIDQIRAGALGFVAAGTINQPGASRMTLWRSSDGRAWHEDPAPITLPTGSLSSVTGLAVAGDDVFVGAVTDGGVGGIWHKRGTGPWYAVPLPAGAPHVIQNIDLDTNSAVVAVAARGPNASGVWRSTRRAH